MPPSIIKNEYLPALARDPNALARIGLQMTHNKDGSIRIYQPPGEKNALGRIRFNFPNKFLVYQHDTPQKHLFAQQQRAYSHGCTCAWRIPRSTRRCCCRSLRPMKNNTAERIRKMYGDRERTLTFKTPIPVHLTYQTAFFDDAGQFQTRPDIYGHDKTMIGLLHNGRSGSDTPIARNNNSSSKPVVARSPNRPEDQPQARRNDWGFDRSTKRMVRRTDPFAPPGYIAPTPYFGSSAARRTYGAPN